MLGLFIFFYPILFPFFGLINSFWRAFVWLVVKPIKNLVIQCMKILGLYDALIKRYHQLIGLIDKYGNLLLKTVSKGAKYVVLKWIQVSNI